MSASDRQTWLQQQLLLATSDVDGLSQLIVRLKSVTPTDEARVERAVERWIETNMRLGELREELKRLDRGQGRDPDS